MSIVTSSEPKRSHNQHCYVFYSACIEDIRAGVSIIGVYTDWDFMLSHILEHLLNEVWDLVYDESCDTDEEFVIIEKPRLPTNAEELAAIFKFWSSVNRGIKVRVDKFKRLESIKFFMERLNYIYYVRKITLY